MSRALLFSWKPLQGSVDQQWDRPGKGQIFQNSTAMDYFHLGSAAASSSGVNHVPEELLPTQRLPGILYTLHLPFPSAWTVEFFSGLGVFLNLGVLKVTFWFTFGVAICLLCSRL